MNRIPVLVDAKCNLEHPIGYIYLTINRINGHKYVGKHCCTRPEKDTYYLGSGVIFLKALSKYGSHNFDNYVLEWFDNVEQLNQAEIIWIKEFDAVKSSNFYNLRTGGEGFSSEDIKLFWELGMFKDISGENNPSKSKETRQKLSIATTQYYEQHPEIKAIRGEKHKKFWKEHREVFPQCRTGKDSPFYNSGSPVLCVETQMLFCNANRAADWVKDNYQNYPKASGSKIRDCCKGRCKTAYKFHWEYPQNISN